MRYPPGNLVTGPMVADTAGDQELWEGQSHKEKEQQGQASVLQRTKDLG